MKVCCVFVFFATQIVRAQAPSVPIDVFFQQTFEEQLREDPEFASYAGRHEYDDRWTDQSRTAREERKAALEQSLKTLRAYEKAGGLSKENDVTARLLDYDWDLQLRSWDLQEHLLRIRQLLGFHIQVYQVIDRMRPSTVQGYENIIARLNAIPVLVDQNIAILDEAIREKLMRPTIVAEQVTAQLKAQMNQDTQHTRLLDAFREFPQNIPAPDQERLRNDAVAA